MFLNVSIKSIVRICFYLILIVVCVTSWIKFLKEPTAFIEKVVYNKARLPSFTLCPGQINGTNSNKSIENFEDIKKEIEHVANTYTMLYAEHKPYEQDKLVENKYNNDTSFGVSYFAPKISTYPPYEIVICLIWTPSREHKIKPDWNFGVRWFF